MQIKGKTDAFHNPIDLVGTPLSQGDARYRTLGAASDYTVWLLETVCGGDHRVAHGLDGTDRSKYFRPRPNASEKLTLRYVLSHPRPQDFEPGSSVPPCAGKVRITILVTSEENEGRMLGIAGFL